MVSNYQILEVRCCYSTSLLNTMNKMLKAIIFNKFTEFAERNSFLSKSQIRAKKLKNENDFEIVH